MMKLRLRFLLMLIVGNNDFRNVLTDCIIFVCVTGELNCAFKQRRKESAQGIVERVGDLLVKRVKHQVIYFFR